MKIRKCKYNFGNNNDGVFSTINGYATETNNFGETAVGILNKSTLDPDTFTSPDVVTSSKATLFSVGNGSDNVRKNAFEIKANGDTYINGVGGYDGTNSEDATSVGESIQSVQDSSNKFAEDIESIHIEKSATGDTYVLKVAGEDRGTITDESGVSFTPGNGLQLVDTDLSVKIDPTSESYLTAGQDGLKISGIDAKFGDYLPLTGGTIKSSTEGSSRITISADSTNQDFIAITDTRGIGMAEYGPSGVTIYNKKQTDLLNAAGGTLSADDIASNTVVTYAGKANGLASLNDSGKIPESQLPSYVDDVVEYSSIDDFPETGESGKIYIATDTNMTYRWAGSSYVAISSSLALGETSSTAYAGDKGKANRDALNSLPSTLISSISRGEITGSSIVINVNQATKSGLNYESPVAANLTFTAATNSIAGLMSASDKQKLDGLSNYTLPVASATSLGGVRVGDGLEITEEGVLNCTIDPGSGTVSWGDIQGKPTFSTVATSGLYSDLTGTPDLSNYVTSTQLTSIAGSNTYTGANYISKETNLTDVVMLLDEEIKAVNDNLDLEHANAEATYVKKAGDTITGDITVTDGKAIVFEGDNTVVDNRRLRINHGGVDVLARRNPEGWANSLFAVYNETGDTKLETALGVWGEGDQLRYFYIGGEYNSPKVIVTKDGKLGVGQPWWLETLEMLEVNGNAKATKFIGPLQGNADTATKATQDANGDVIADTYAKKTELSSYLPLSGGTLTGTLHTPALSVTGNMIVGSHTFVTGSNTLSIAGPDPSNLIRLASSGLSSDSVTISVDGISFSGKDSSDILTAAGSTTKLKTINSQSLLGEGNIEIQVEGGGITDAPSDGKLYGRKNAQWAEVTIPEVEVPTKVSELTNDLGFQTEAQVSAKISALVDSAPETLDTLNELAAALGDDPNFATTITTQLGNKLDTSTYNSDKATFALKSELPSVESITTTDIDALFS